MACRGVKTLGFLDGRSIARNVSESTSAIHKINFTSRLVLSSYYCTNMSSMFKRKPGPSVKSRGDDGKGDFSARHKRSSGVHGKEILNEIDSVVAQARENKTKSSKLRISADLLQQPGITLHDQRSPVDVSQKLNMRLGEAFKLKKKQVLGSVSTIKYLDVNDRLLIDKLHDVTNISRPVPIGPNFAQKHKHAEEVLPQNNSYEHYGVHPKLVTSLARQGITTPTDVQQKCLQLVASKSDILIHSETGSGKTLAFLLPILQEPGPLCGTVIMVPSRELAFQIYEVACSLLSKPSIVGVYVMGNEEDEEMLSRFRNQIPRILIGTPKALALLVTENEEKFDKVKRILVDEVDHILGKKLLESKNKKKRKKTKTQYGPEDGHIKAYEKVLAALQALNSRKPQLIASSATMDATLVNELSNLGWKEGLQVVKSPTLKDKPYNLPSCIEHQYFLFQESKGLNSASFLLRAFRSIGCKSALAFVKTLTSPQKLVSSLQELDIKAVALHSGLSVPTERSRFLKDFRNGTLEVAVATEDIVRGLDIKALDHVILTMVPNTAGDYVHLSGRVGRQGRVGTVTTLVSSKTEEELKRYLAIMRELNVKSTLLE